MQYRFPKLKSYQHGNTQYLLDERNFCKIIHMNMSIRFFTFCLPKIHWIAILLYFRLIMLQTYIWMSDWWVIVDWVSIECLGLLCMQFVCERKSMSHGKLLLSYSCRCRHFDTTTDYIELTHTHTMMFERATPGTQINKTWWHGLRLRVLGDRSVRKVKR